MCDNLKSGYLASTLYIFRNTQRMAVKKHEVVRNISNQLDLQALVNYLKLMNDQSGYLPPPMELVQNCQDIVQCLTKGTSNEEQMRGLVQSVEVFLLHVVHNVHCTIRHEIVTATMSKLYSLISDPQSEIPAPMSIVLSVLDGLDNEAMLSKARWLVQQGEIGPSDSGFKAALSHLYRWLQESRCTPVLGDWVLAYVKALEENERFQILIETSVECLGHLFLALGDSAGIRMSAANVIFHIMASMRKSHDALDRISQHVRLVLTKLASDSQQNSREILQNVVDILTAMIDNLTEPLKGKDLDAFKIKYADMISCLETHLASPCSRFQQVPLWQTRDINFGVNLKPPTRKVGLLNLGNTCYMNGVMQALLVTRKFSTHVMVRMNGAPYWSMLGVLFAKMMHSYNTILNPEEYFTVIRPPFFTIESQHDSSEFLGYLFLLLQSYEHRSDVNFDYTRPPVLTAPFRLPRVSYASHTQASQSSLTPSDGESTSRGSSSPRPGSSAGGSGTNLKRALSNKGDLSVPLKKRLRQSFDSTYLRRDSIIDSMFGGVLLTRVECTVCLSSSLSRDVFRDLQLAFPDKIDGSRHSVQSLLEFYCSKESLTGDNKYQCHDCGMLRDAERSVLIETTPKYLILVLKNFKFEPKVQLQTKLMHQMHHNMSVTLPTVRGIVQPTTYTLYAAVIHNGNTLDSGHYYTLAKDNGQWHIYNDETVTPSDEHEFTRLHPYSTPYILFYKRTDVDDGTVPSFEELPAKVQETVIAHNKDYMETVRNIQMSRP